MSGENKSFQSNIDKETITSGELYILLSQLDEKWTEKFAKLEESMNDFYREMRGHHGDNGFVGRLGKVETKQNECLKAQSEQKFLRPKWVIVIIGAISLATSIGSSLLTIFLAG